MLATDIDRDFVLSGICLGFPLVLDISEVSPADECNYKSALNCDTKPILDELFREELLTQKLTEVQDKPLRIQAIGAVPKKDSAVPRPITDCSRPFGDSLNSYISTEKFSFVSVEAATALCKPGSFMAIVDIKSAYRAIPILPQHRKLQGIRWQFTGDQLPRYLVDNFLCFGLSNAPGIFNRISCAIVRMLDRAGIKCVSYLDDFLVIADTLEECQAAQMHLISLLLSLGLPINWGKLISPSQRVIFLGIIIDTNLQRIELPTDKLERLTDLASEYSLRRKVTKRELQIIVGHMTFASRAIFAARAFTRLFIDAMNQLEKPTHTLRISAILRNELIW